VEVKLPAPLARLANRPPGRYRLSCQSGVHLRGDEVAAQAATGAVRYDISCDPVKDRWHLDASWRTEPAPARPLDGLREHPVLAVDLNHGHLAAWLITPDGNAAGAPATVPLDLAGLPAATRDGRLRAAITTLITLASQHSCHAIAVEDLDFAEARAQGRERAASRPSRGRRGRGFRRLVSGLPTARFRDRLVQMTSNAGLAVIAAGPGIHVPVGQRALARPPPGPAPRCQRPPCGGRGDRQACARLQGAQTRRRDRRPPEDQPPESCPPSARVQARQQERPAPPGPAAATPAVAEDRDGPAATPARPGSPGPPGAAG
jgi:hypothetical protein